MIGYDDSTFTSRMTHNVGAQSWLGPDLLVENNEKKLRMKEIQ